MLKERGKRKEARMLRRVCAWGDFNRNRECLLINDKATRDVPRGRLLCVFVGRSKSKFYGWASVIFDPLVMIKFHPNGENIGSGDTLT